MTRKPASMYVHPWDVVDEGPETVLERITGAGINTINLATSYHSGRYILQHNPKKKVYFAEEGVVYFEPELSYWRKSELKPRRSTEYAGVDVLKLLLAEAKRFGVGVNSWTVTLHNSALARGHPEAAIVDAFGGIDYNHLCPNNPLSRAYHSALVRNLTDYDLKAIQLESSSFSAALQHGDHHEAFGTPVEPIVSELMTGCFCDHCLDRAKRLGLDLGKARKLVRKLVDRSLGLPIQALKNTSFSETIRTSYFLSTELSEIREIHAFQRQTVADLFSETSQNLKDLGSKAKLNVITYGGFSGEPSFGRGAEGVSLSVLGKTVDGIDLITYMSEPDGVRYVVEWCRFVAGDCPMFVALRPSYPVLFSEEAVVASVKNAMEGGATGVAFYNYGWTPLRNFDWIRSSVE